MQIYHESELDCFLSPSHCCCGPSMFAYGESGLSQTSPLNPSPWMLYFFPSFTSSNFPSFSLTPVLFAR